MKFLALLSFLCSIIELNCENSLVFVHAIFRHGDRTPEPDNFYQASQYMNESFFKPYGFGQLTNKGKLNSYNLGKAFRSRYSDFLDEEYNIKLIDARSSDYSRSKASLQAVLAGLFPPSKDLVWLEGVNWQPIPYNYVDRSADKELYCFGCPSWFDYFYGYAESPEGKLLISQYEPTAEYVTEKTGQNYDFFKLYSLYFGFEILNELNYPVPDWTASVYPYPLRNSTLLFYEMILATKELRQLGAGFLLKKIMSDTQEKVDGKVPEKKISLWSAHENNIASLLQILNVWDKKELPHYGCHILLELHFIDQKYGFKIYYNNNQSVPVLLRIPGCEEFCPLDQFKALVEKDIPESDNICRSASMASRPTETNWFIISILCIASLMNTMKIIY